MDQLRVGIIGANPERGWAQTAHLPAFAGIDGIHLTAVATTRAESAGTTAAKFSVAHAFDNAEDLVACDEVDAVAVSVKTPHHYELTRLAIDAGKHVFTEWPLGRTSAEAEDLLARAEAAGVANVIGLQGRKSPMFNYVRHLVADGYVGDLRSVSLSIVMAGRGGTTITPERVWTTDRANGTTQLSIIGGHTLDLLRYCVGDLRELSATVATLDRTLTVAGTSETVEVTASDNVLVQGRLAGGALFDAQVLSGPVGNGARVTIRGTRGVLEVTGGGSPHLADKGFTLVGSEGGGEAALIEVPDSYRLVPDAVPEGPARNVGALYLALKAAAESATPAEPNFAVAVELHHLLDAIQAASDAGEVQRR